ncbi:MAG TPA: hypothetical protein VK846_00530 [Candidatus Limnocylindria bacterium]|nr:hypothetical protein [Candidatus Limnocylindria bacterium]
MKLQLCPHFRNRGSTLIMTLFLSGAILMVLMSTLDWTQTNTTLAFRNNEYYRTIAVAEAATEQVVAQIESDYQWGGETEVKENLADYRALCPTASVTPAFANYAFNDGQGNSGKTYVEWLPPSAFKVLNSQYEGLYGYASTFRVISNARETTSRFNITGAVAQQFDVATIPLFQFAIFYNLDLEINPGADMGITGPTHSNQKIYLDPGATLTFYGDVTSANSINPTNKPGDPDGPRPGPFNFAPGVKSEGFRPSLNLPIGTNNTPDVVRQVVEIPPSSEDASSDMGKQRFYNKADLVIKIMDNTNIVTSGINDSFNTLVPTNQWTNFLNLKNTFVNRRESSKTVKVVEIDIAKLRKWSEAAYGSNGNQNILKQPTKLTNGEVQIVYVADLRWGSTNGSSEPGIRLVNGQVLPTKGLTIASPDPIYILGNYNTSTNSVNPTANPNSGGVGTTDTRYTRPAAVVGDAITVLSADWIDADSNDPLVDRDPVNTTVNAAFLAGIVQTVPGNYSGGVENFPRFLEDWSGVTFTYNGSMVVMYESRLAKAPWGRTGATVGHYNAPTRRWAFDTNFRDPTKLPPGTPMVRTLVRGAWAMIQPNSTNMVVVGP